MYREKRNLIIAGIAVVISSAATLIAPIIIGNAMDTSIVNHDYSDLFMNGLLLFWVYCFGTAATYVQTIVMGWIGRETLFHLRNQLFTKIQELPLSFFNQNKTGDLISRINNDTDKLNQFFSQAFTQFLGNLFLVVGSAIFIISLNIELGIVSLLPALGVLIITQLISPWVKRKTLASLQSLGGMSAEIQESLNNFKVVVAFNRMDYFTNKFEEFNTINYKAAIYAGIAGNVLTPLYTLASNLAQLVFLVFGIHLIMTGHITIGLFISFQIYLNNFYSPLKQLAAIWSSFQLALASIDRIYEVLDLDSDMPILSDTESISQKGILRFQDVSFQYPDGKKVLQNVNFTMEKWKTYALVGPTGWWKTTTAMLSARMYDPSTWQIFLDGKDIRSYAITERTNKIGFILQEPFLFTWTIKENILYGNNDCQNYSDIQLLKKLKELDLDSLLWKFENGLETRVSPNGESISLWQKQIIAFMRAIIRSPDILILDEATANIDTITEEILESMLQKLPKETTKIIIAHRLNTIKNADTIFFVNAGSLIETGNMEDALAMILHGKRES